MAVRKPVVFLGSSSEALPVVNTLVGLLGKSFRPRPWNQVFTAGEYTFDVLVKEAREADAAVFVFAKDDPLEFREQATFAARDNVILEYGLFVSELGRDRVLILEEEGVKLPSDLLGMTIDEYPSGDDIGRNAMLQGFAEKAIRRWPTPRSRQADEQDAGLGYAKTLGSERQKLDGISKILSEFVQTGTATETEPIRLNATAPLSCYAEALGLVQQRFWTTTFLSSGFWTRSLAKVMDANEDMLARIKDRGGTARRLFLLDQPADMVVQAYRDHRVLQRQLRKDDELRRLDSEHRNLKNNMAALLKDGFEVRVAFDEDDLWSTGLPREFAWNPQDSELAVYDDFRVDVFEGGKRGVVHGLTTFSKAARYFDSYLGAANDYFDALWTRASPMAEFIDELQEAVDLAEAKIDYETNWLAIYEYALPEEDQRLKTVEMARVEEVLREAIEAGLEVRRFLDVGTCTGRYPIQLRDHVVGEGCIIGVDEDYDCVRFAQANVTRQCENDRRITISQCNFAGRQVSLDPPFELITCMLGTLSHFGWDRRADGEDAMDRVLDRMAGLLSPDGLLFLGTWSAYATSNRKMLDIYRVTDTWRLCRWTVTLDELDRGLEKAGLEVVGRASPELRLDLTWCRRMS